MAKRHTNHMKATVWTPTMSSEMSGTPDGVIPLAFYALATKKRRDHCIEQLQKINDEMTARTHECYTNDDKYKPEIICDSNGEVVLALCKHCSAGEAELTERECTGPQKEGA